ncbi:DUF1963 domain-containing protein [Halomonas sp. SpR1]|uniref:DUF1963 domain-containing protein n=1 Tax=Halomonas sp. SpR1 TaxID=3050462 RepID=UPI0027E3F246|nr:DUF1963 domain-containing protein [Halomonas sp. SpR1]MDQ7735335.1 DUF1963 domain-containing protein [Halomonas sp. SpR1]
MINETELARDYAEGIESFKKCHTLGGSFAGCRFVMPFAIGYARQLTVDQWPAFNELTEEEKFAAGMIHRILASHDFMGEYPRLMPLLVAFEYEIRRLLASPLKRSLLQRKLTQESWDRVSHTVYHASNLVSEIKKEGIPVASSEVETDSKGILVYRRPRQVGDDWFGARSWFGGAPRLGDLTWPRSAEGYPLHFVAQFDLAEIAAECGQTELPCEGSLAFFTGRASDEECAVIEIPPGVAEDFSEVPEGRLPFDEVGLEKPGMNDLLPFWPVGFMPYETDSGKRDSACREELAKHNEPQFERRSFTLSAATILKGLDVPHWYQIAFHYRDSLLNNKRRIPARIAEIQQQIASIQEAEQKPDARKIRFGADVNYHTKRIEAIHRLQPAFDRHLAEVNALCEARAPWSLMPEDEWQRLDALWRKTPEFYPITEYSDSKVSADLSLSEDMLRKLPKADDPSYRELPAEVRDFIEHRQRPRPQWWYSAYLIEDAIKHIDEEDEPLPPAFEAFRAEVSLWVADHDPWQQMDEDDAERLAMIHRRCHDEFRKIVSYRVPYSFGALETITLRLMLAGEDSVYARLPEEARARVNRHYLLPIRSNHQMFGIPLEMQSNAREENYDRHLLLQLTDDDVNFFYLNGSGTYQFWISPAELKKRKCEAVNITFECD